MVHLLSARSVSRQMVWLMNELRDILLSLHAKSVITFSCIPWQNMEVRVGSVKLLPATLVQNSSAYSAAVHSICYIVNKCSPVLIPSTG